MKMLVQSVEDSLSRAVTGEHLDIVAEALGELTSLHEGKPKFRAFIAAILREVQWLVDAGEKIMLWMDIDHAEGESLKRIAEIVGAPLIWTEVEAEALEGVQVISGGPDGIFDGATYSIFQYNLNQNATASVIAAQPGKLYTFVLRQNAAAGHDFVWPDTIVNAGAINLQANGLTTQTFVVAEDGTLYAIGAATWSTFQGSGGVMQTVIDAPMQRFVIRAQILKNHSHGFTPEMSESLSLLFGAEFAFVWNNKDMSFDVNIAHLLTAMEIYLLRDYDILPRPAGVQLRDFVYWDNELPVFGFEHQTDTAGFDEGYFALAMR